LNVHFSSIFASFVQELPQFSDAKRIVLTLSICSHRAIKGLLLAASSWKGSMQAFKDRVGLVTGSTGEGLSRSIAFTLAREGAKVVVNYGTGHPNNSHAADKVLKEIRTLGGKGYAFKADTREENEVQSMIDGIVTLYGRLDYLICNAGGAWEAKDITEIEQEHWRSG
jgi:hypothetical protein